MFAWESDTMYFAFGMTGTVTTAWACCWWWSGDDKHFCYAAVAVTGTVTRVWDSAIGDLVMTNTFAMLFLPWLELWLECGCSSWWIGDNWHLWSALHALECGCGFYFDGCMFGTSDLVIHWWTFVTCRTVGDLL